MQDDLVGVDLVGVRKLYEGDSVARAAMNHFASRERNFSETTVESLEATLAKEAPFVTRQGVVHLFQRLERLGCGKFILGRRFNKSRMAWRVSNIALAKAAQSAGDSAEMQTSPPATDDLVADPRTAVGSGDQEIEHTFRLRPEVVVRVKLPGNFKSAEAERLAAFIRSLPFGG